MYETKKLARFAKNLSYDELPREVVNKAKELILDQLGCEVAGADLPWSQKTYEYVRDIRGQIKESTVIRYGLKTTSQDAAFANANFGHGFLADDTDPVSKAHLGSIIIPSAMAISEKANATGKDFIRAVIIGYEIALRIAAAAPFVISRGFHPGPVFGPLGVAASAGILLGLDENQITDALGIAGSHSSGLMEYSESGGSVNRLHAGIAAHGGIRSCLLAQRGFTGPKNIVEGRKGVCRAFSDTNYLDEITRGLGIDFSILRIGLKPYCCCGTKNGALDAISNITSHNPLNPNDIVEITVETTNLVMGLSGSIVEPEDITSAQFSGRFGIALRLIKGGNGFGEYTEGNLRDPDILSLVAKTKYLISEELEKASDEATRLRVKLLNGKVYEDTVFYPKGTVQNPMTRGEINDKFRSFSSTVLNTHKVENIIEAVDQLEKLDNMRDLLELLVSE